MTSTSISTSSSAELIHTRSNVSRTLAYIRANTRNVFANTSFVVFTVALPVALYLLFNSLYGTETVQNTTASVVMMVTMGVYGAFAAALNSGAAVQVERSTGWFRQLQLTGISTRGFVAGKISTSMLVVLPALIFVFIAGFTAGHVHLSAAHWIEMGLTIWVSLIPMVLLGITVALWVGSAAVQPVITLVMFAMSIIGGLWVPMEALPSTLQNVGKNLPTYWISQLGLSPVTSGIDVAHGVNTLVIWTIVLAVLSIIGFRRAARTRQ